MNDPVTAARERLERLLPDVLRYDPVSMPAFDQRIDALIEAVRAEAGGVSVEALLDAWEAQEHPSIDAAIQAALAARSAGSGSLVECGWCNGSGAIMGGQTCLDCHGSGTRPTPAPVDVTPEHVARAFLDIEYPEVFADGESRRLSAALAARSAGSGSRVERER